MHALQTALLVVIARCKRPLTNTQARRLKLGRLARPARFGLVGLSGMALNTAIVWVLVRGAHLPVLAASALATEVSILHNFLINDRWTFRAGLHSFTVRQRFLRFNGVALGGLAVTAGLLDLLTNYGRLDLLPANLVAIGGAVAWNYVVNCRLTWRDAAAADRSPLNRRQG